MYQTGLENLPGCGSKWLIKFTDDYDIFKEPPKRKPRFQQSILEGLKKSILTDGWIPYSVIIVDSTMAVFNGHHRIEVLRQIKKETGKVFEIAYVKFGEGDRVTQEFLMRETRDNFKRQEEQRKLNATNF